MADNNQANNNEANNSLVCSALVLANTNNVANAAGPAIIGIAIGTTKGSSPFVVANRSEPSELGKIIFKAITKKIIPPAIVIASV